MNDNDPDDDRLELIHELDQKLDAIAAALGERGILTRASVRAIAAKIHVNVNTLQSARTHWKLKVRDARALADLAGFSPDDESWIDRSLTTLQRKSEQKETYPGRDTAIAFARQLRTTMKLGAAVQLRVRGKEPDHVNPNLLRMEVYGEGQAVDVDQGLRLFATFISLTDFDGDVRFGFARLRFQLVLKSDNLSATRHLGNPVYSIRDATLRVTGTGSKKAGGMSRGSSAFWTLEAAQHFLDGEYTAEEDPICLLMGAKLGSTLRAEIAVNLNDSTSIIAETGKPVSTETREVLRKLFERSLSDEVADSNGWKTLGTQWLTVTR